MTLTELANGLANRVFLIKEYALGGGRSNRDGGGGNADGFVCTDEVHLARLRDGVLGRGGLQARGRVGVDAFHVDGTCKEDAESGER